MNFFIAVGTAVFIGLMAWHIVPVLKVSVEEGQAPGRRMHDEPRFGKQSVRFLTSQKASQSQSAITPLR